METTERKIYECLAKIAKMDRIVLLLSTPVPTPDLLLEFLESVVSVERKKRCAPQVNKEPEVRLHVLKAADSLMSVQRTGRANRPKALTQNSWSDKNLSDSIASTRRPVLSMRRPNSRLCLSLLVCFLASTAPVLGGGFGVNKMVVELVRVHPPQVFLFADAVSVSSVSPDPAKSTLAERLRGAVETQIWTSKQRVASPSEQPDAVVELNLLESNVWESSELRKRREYKKVGEEKVWDSKKNKYETKDKYAYIDVFDNYKIVNGAQAASYKLIDAAGNSFDSSVFKSHYRQEFKDGISTPGLDTVENVMMTEIAGEVARHLFPTKQQLEVLLPKGSFEDVGKLAQAGQWDQYLKSLENFPLHKKPQDDAYREYAIGVCYEALGYRSEDADKTLEYLERAARQYDTAIESNRDEKFFSEGWRDEMSPRERVRSGVDQYRKYKEFVQSREEWEKSTQRALQVKGGTGASVAEAATPVRGALVPGTSVAGRSPTVAANSATMAGAAAPLAGNAAGVSVASGPTRGLDQALRNSDIIEMVKAGLSPQNIKLAIDAAEKTEFDLTPRGLIELSKAGVSNDIIAYLQTHQKKLQ